MTYVGGLAGQAGRNAILEPWRANTRAEGGATRAGEVTTDALFIAGGGGVAALGARMATSSGSLLGRIGGAAIGAVGVLAAATGVKNLFAKLPGSPAPTPTPEPGPTPNPSPGPSPEPTPDPTPTPTPTPDPTPDPLPNPDPEHPPHPPHTPGEPHTPPVHHVPQPHHDPQPKPVVHAVRPGETLTFIADCYETDWRKLYTYNRKEIGSNPDILRIGTRLRIPPKDYDGRAFHYQPTAKPGQLPSGLACLPDSPKAIDGNCPKP